VLSSSCRRAALAAGALLASFLAVPTPAAAQTPGEPGQIAVVRQGSGSPSGLYLMDADGSNARFIWGGHQMVQPDWSPDGTRVVVATPPSSSAVMREVFVQEMGGNGTRIQLTHDQSEDKTSPAWSPDGTEIAYSGANGHLYVIPADGATGRRTLQISCAANPTWTPDGAQIVFTNCDDREIYRVPADFSSPPEALTQNDVWDMQPDVSPDGDSIVYVHGGPGGGEQLWLMDPDGGNQRQLHAEGISDLDPAFSPDGGSVVFAAPDPDDNYRNRLFVIDVETGAATRLDSAASPDQQEFYVGWQPRQAGADAQAPWISTPGITARAMPYGSTLTSFACVDVVDPAPQCTATLDGAPIAEGTPLDGTAVGSHRLAVTARDAAGNPATRTIDYRVLAPGAVETTVEPGQTVSTASTPTAAMPVVAAITVPDGVPTGSTLTVTPQTPAADPAGYRVLGQQMVIEGPAATAASPYTLTLVIDRAALGTTPINEVQVLRNGVAVPDCTSETQAAPDPCVAQRALDPADETMPRGTLGNGRLVMRTSHFSTWSLAAKAALRFDLRGPLAPVDAAPVVNTARAGTVIPLRFSLGGNQGLDVLAGPPQVAPASCGNRRDEVELILPSLPFLRSALAYDPRSQQYVYLWATDRSMRGCRALTLTFRDGSTLRTLYQLR
jgi:dipeptidyl aminopeptidase/acylaminoacyl peptidase